jgi:hypothetical protein
MTAGKSDAHGRSSQTQQRAIRQNVTFRYVARRRHAPTVPSMENVTPPGTPAKRALAVLDTPPAAEGLTVKRISKKVRTAIDLMVSGECKKICDAAAKVGLARESLSRALSTPTSPRICARRS